VHPLCLTVKRVEPDRIVVITCSSCRMVHRVTTGAITSQTSAADSSSPRSRPAHPDGLVALKVCLGTHAPALSVREMDVFQDAVWVRCAECRAQYDLTVSQFETHQK
jgi:RNase P subunit RPR2